MTPSEIEPATFRFVAQHLTTVPQRSPIQIKVRIYSTVGGDPILYSIEVTSQNEIFYPINESASQLVTHHSTSHNVSVKLNTTPTALRHDTHRTGSEVCMRVPATQFQVPIQSNFQGYSATVITQGLTIKPLKMLALY